MSWRMRQMVTTAIKIAWEKGCDPYNSAEAAAAHYQRMWLRKQRHQLRR